MSPIQQTQPVSSVRAAANKGKINCLYRLRCFIIMGLLNFILLSYLEKQDRQIGREDCTWHAWYWFTASKRFCAISEKCHIVNISSTDPSMQSCSILSLLPFKKKSWRWYTGSRCGFLHSRSSHFLPMFLTQVDFGFFKVPLCTGALLWNGRNLGMGWGENLERFSLFSKLKLITCTPVNKYFFTTHSDNSASI